MDPDAIHCNINKKEQQTSLLFYTKRSHNASSKTDKNTFSEKKKWILTHVASKSIRFVETFNLIASNINEFVLMPLHYCYIIKYLNNSTKLQFNEQ